MSDFSLEFWAIDAANAIIVATVALGAGNDVLPCLQHGGKADS
jgi:hypothetical protein